MCQISPLSRKFEENVNHKGREVQTFSSGARFGTFFDNDTKVKTSSEIMLTYVMLKSKTESFTCHHKAIYEELHSNFEFSLECRDNSKYPPRLY